MSYLDLSKKLLREHDSPRLDVPTCLELLTELHASLRGHYEPGAAAWAFDHIPELKQRFDETETAIDRLAGQRPTETAFRAALEAHAMVWREISGRYRAHQEYNDDHRGHRRRP